MSMLRRCIHCLLVQTCVGDVGECTAKKSLSSIILIWSFYMQSMELSGIRPRGGIFPGAQDGGSIPLMLGDGSTFSLSSILSATPSQLIWKRVTRGLEAKIFLWSCKKTFFFMKYESYLWRPEGDMDVFIFCKTPAHFARMLYKSCARLNETGAENRNKKGVQFIKGTFNS